MTTAELDACLAASAAGGRVHLIGAGGCGMVCLGHILLDLGFQVSGSDMVAGKEVAALRARGASIAEGHCAQSIEQSPPAWVVYSPAVGRANPELLAAEALGLPLARRAEFLAALFNRRRGIAVAGMHGKTTTTALLAWCLEKLSAGVGYAIGGLPRGLDRPGRWGTGPTPGNAAGWFIAEADESDGTLCLYQPEVALLLNVDRDHLDHFSSLDAACREFERLAAQTKMRVVYCADDPGLAGIQRCIPGAVSYGFAAAADWKIEPVARPPAEAQEFRLRRGAEVFGPFALSLIGRANLSNAAGAAAVMLEMGCAAAEIAPHLAAFPGVHRRQEVLCRDARCVVYDDYGHHPAEIRAVLDAVGSRAAGRLLVVFEPHRFTRTQCLMDDFAASFAGVAEVWLMEIYPAGEHPIEGVSSDALAVRMRALEPQRPVHRVDAPSAVRDAVLERIKGGDTVVCLGAGSGVTTVAHELAGRLRAAAVHAPGCVDLAARIEAAVGPGSIVRRNESLARRTTLRVGGAADWYLEPATEAGLAALLQLCAREGLEVTLLGRGSNLLIRDGGIRGVVVCLAHKNFSQIETMGARLKAGAGARLKAVCAAARRHGLAGLEFLEGIPGSVGGALRMNAGAMGSWAFEVVESVRLMSRAGEVSERRAGEISYEYRGCPLFRTHIAIGAVFAGMPASPEAVGRRMESFSARRWHAQPKEPSAGCIFKNPDLIPAGRLIEELGLKGRRLGGARISEAHGNFIVNEGTATARDVLALIEVIRAEARHSRGIELQTEVEILGEDN